MRTAHFSDSEGGLCTETPLDKDPPRQRPLDKDPLGRDPQTETPRQGPPGQRPPGRNMGPGNQTGSDIIQRPPSCEQNE